MSTVPAQAQSAFSTQDSIVAPIIWACSAFPPRFTVVTAATEGTQAAARRLLQPASPPPWADKW